MRNPFWSWWQGYLTILLRGAGIERLLNQAVSDGLALSNIQRLTGSMIILRIKIGDFAKLRTLLWDYQIQAQILNRHGAPFSVKKLARRLFLALGLVMAFLVLFYLSNFVWFIEVTGHNSLDLQDFTTTVQDLGLNVGMRRSKVDRAKLEHAILEKYPLLVWTQVRVKGVKVEIQVVEQELTELESVPSEPGHIYASLSGVISEILVLKGRAVVEKGATVLEGDQLISGEYYDSQGKKQFGAAQGIVRAKVWHQGIGEVSYVQWEPELTGVSHRRYELALGSIALPFGRSYSSPNYSQTVKEWSLSLGSAMAPLKWRQLDYLEVNYIPHPISPEKARALAYDLAWENLKAKLDDEVQILQEKVQEEPLQEGEGVRITIAVEVMSDIGEFSQQ